jgi:hypothetical protein
MNNWNRGIKYSVKNSYSFLNKVFDSPQLKITSQLIAKRGESRVLPITVTIEYVTDIGNIEDSVFEILPGLDKAITTILYIPQEYPYRMKIDNPNTSVVQVTADTLKVVRKVTPIAINNRNIINGDTITNNNYLSEKDSKDNDVNIVFTNGEMPQIS